jgi:hypothetical protein
MKDKELNQLQEKFYHLVLYGRIINKYRIQKRLSDADTKMMENIILMYPDECKEIDDKPCMLEFNEGYWEAIKFIREN